jgi:AraC-like DNA-binding protein
MKRARIDNRHHTNVSIRIDDGPRPERLELLRHAVADTIAPFEPRIDPACELSAEFLSGRVGAVHVTRLRVPPMRADRTPRLIRASDPELFKVDVQIRGQTVIRQGGREASLAPGDLTLMDLSRPSQLTDRASAQAMVAVAFPRAALSIAPNELDRLTAVPVSGRQGFGAAVSVVARQLALELERDERADGPRLSAALTDMLAVALAERLDRVDALTPAARRRALLARLQSFIDQRLADPALTPAAIAEANHISLRYLHKLFEVEETTVASWIRRRRLERDAAHFNRIFRAAYGVPPAQYRRAPSASIAAADHL